MDRRTSPAVEPIVQRCPISAHTPCEKHIASPSMRRWALPEHAIVQPSPPRDAHAASSPSGISCTTIMAMESLQDVGWRANKLRCRWNSRFGSRYMKHFQQNARRANFSEYIRTRRTTETEAGQLVAEMLLDINLPRDIDSWSDLLRYLDSRNMTGRRFAAAKAVWKTFEKQRERRRFAMRG